MANPRNAAKRRTWVTGRRFCLIGSLDVRAGILELLRQQGGQVLPNIRKDLDYLVVGRNPGHRLDEARRLGTVMILKEQTLLRRLMLNAHR